ncbi:DUF998 domain-containing protein [Pseudonocardia xinjiangensis]|uniref:DUF998 domain-containing protein n=1 Tax=Pseudonocardia xinjiangensis TaxID=75289 RepID=A0ABX1RLG5_9PSEU|nr:DUF998 domain-containing protein [Pseudonocardia xinjiangensis]NMH80812.1 DUF998 domain-containing protein [Pseudonocardia xinjiangensis]
MQRPAPRWPGIGTSLLAVLAILAAGRAMVLMLYLGVAYRHEVDPISQPLSFYEFVDGAADLLGSAVVALAVGTQAVVLGMARAGVRLAGRPAVLFITWTACLLVAAIFPTDDSPQILTVSGWVHQFAGAGIFALLSLAGFAAAPRLAESPAWLPVVGLVRRLSAGAAVLAVVYVVSRLNDWIPGFVSVFGGVDPGGLLQRMALLVHGAVVAVLAVHLLRVSWPAARSRTGPWPADTAASGAAPPC